MPLGDAIEEAFPGRSGPNTWNNASKPASVDWNKSK
jgi:hypothetical protein